MESSDILEFVVLYINDVKTLAKCYLASKRLQCGCVSQVQQRLPTLLAGAHADAFQVFQNPNYVRKGAHKKPLEWLYRTAGREAVGSLETATALLRTSSLMPLKLRRVLVPLALDHGITISTEAVVAASKARAALDLGPEGVSLSGGVGVLLHPAVRVSAAIKAVFGDSGQLQTVLPQLTPQHMPDLLHVTVNLQSRTSAALALLEHDSQVTHVLYGDISDSSAADSNNKVHLVQQLLTTSIIRRHWSVTEKLCATPAAQALSEAAVLQLLYQAVKYEDRAQHRKELDYMENSAATHLAGVIDLPAVQLIDTAHVSSLMHFAMQLQQPHVVILLSRLPQAQQLSPKQLSELLLLVARSAPKDTGSQTWLREQQRIHCHLLQCLAGLPCAKQLVPGTAFKLLTLAVQHPLNGELNMYEKLEFWSNMDLGGQLTGSELLQLMVFSVKNRDVASHHLVGLKPAADLIDDEAGYVAFLEQALDVQECRHIDEYIAHIGLTQRLCPDSVVRLVEKCISHSAWANSSDKCISPLLQLSAVQQIAPEPAGHLLLQAARASQVSATSNLLAIPAAAQVPAAVLQELLQTILAFRSLVDRRNWRDLDAVPKVLALPATAEFAAATVAELLMLAIRRQAQEQQQHKEDQQRQDRQRPWWSYDAPSPSAYERIQQTMCVIIQHLLQHPAATQLTDLDAVRLLQAAITANDAGIVGRLCALPAVQHISDARPLYLLALNQADSEVLQALLEQLPQLAAVAATLEPTPEQLTKQMEHAIESRATEQLHDLFKQPAAEQISPKDMQQLLQATLKMLPYMATNGMKCKLTLGAPEEAGDPIWLMIRSPAAQAISATAAAELLVSSIAQQCPAGVELVSLLPAAAQLDTDSCEQLLLQSLQKVHDNNNESNSTDVLWCLLQLPAVQAVPAEVVARLLQSVLELKLQHTVLKLVHSQLPAAQQISSDDARSLMLTAVENRDEAAFNWLEGLPAASIDSEVLAWKVLLGIPESVDSFSLSF